MKRGVSQPILSSDEEYLISQIYEDALNGTISGEQVNALLNNDDRLIEAYKLYSIQQALVLKAKYQQALRNLAASNKQMERLTEELEREKRNRPRTG